MLLDEVSAYATLCSMWTQLPSEKRVHPPHAIFGPCILWPNGWMDEDAAWYEFTGVYLGPGHIVLDGVPAPAKEAQQPPPLFSAILWPRSPISATAELLFQDFINKNSSGDEIVNVNFLRRQRTCRCLRLRPLNRLLNLYIRVPASLYYAVTVSQKLGLERPCS